MSDESPEGETLSAAGAISSTTPGAVPGPSVLEAVVGIGSGLELGTILRRIVTSAAALAGARYAALGVLGEDGQLSEFVHTGMPDRVVERIGPLPEGRGVLGLLLGDGEGPLRLDDLATHPASVGFPPGHPPMRSFLGVPVPVRGQAFGNLYLTEKAGGGGFTQADEDAVVALAAAAGVAVENARLYAQAQQWGRAAQAASDIDTAVLSGASTPDVLELIAVRALEVVDADLAMLALPDARGDLVVEHAAGTLSDGAAAGIVGLRLPGNTAAAQLYDPERSAAVLDLAEVENLAVLSERYHWAIYELLVADARPLGVLLLAHARGRARPSQVEVSAVETFARQAALAIVLGGAQRERERLAVYEDRDRIARDLHDLVIQRLFATGMTLQGALRGAELPPEAAGRISRSIDDLDETIVEVRQTIFALKESESQKPTGLRGQVLREVASAQSSLGFAPVVQFGGPIDSLVSGDLAGHLVAAIREALSNTARHSGAEWAHVSLSVANGEVVLQVSDDGVGLGRSTRRSGLANLQSRAEGAGGSLAFETLSESVERPGLRLLWRAPLG